MAWSPIALAQRGVVLEDVDITPNGMLCKVKGEFAGTSGVGLIVVMSLTLKRFY